MCVCVMYIIHVCLHACMHVCVYIYMCMSARRREGERRGESERDGERRERMYLCVDVFIHVLCVFLHVWQEFPFFFPFILHTSFW